MQKYTQSKKPTVPPNWPTVHLFSYIIIMSPLNSVGKLSESKLAAGREVTFSKDAKQQVMETDQETLLNVLISCPAHCRGKTFPLKLSLLHSKQG